MRLILLCAAGALLGGCSLAHADPPPATPSATTLIYEALSICGAHQIDPMARGAGYQSGYELCAKFVPRVLSWEKRAAAQYAAKELKANRATLAAAEQALENEK